MPLVKKDNVLSLVGRLSVDDAPDLKHALLDLKEAQSPVLDLRDLEDFDFSIFQLLFAFWHEAGSVSAIPPLSTRIRKFLEIVEVL
ncbi:MAG: STAS domain-containing protein [Bacillota bacterium]|jgi:anti-anti-sigma regulatory factor|nr:STAS domain-containing protein [Bacillota bacterium]